MNWPAPDFARAFQEAHPKPGARYVGYFGYGLSKHIEELPSRAMDDLGLPLLMFGRYEPIEAGIGIQPAPDASAPVSIGRTLSPEDYRTKVRRVLDYIAAGDIFQANFAQRFAIL